MKNTLGYRFLRTIVSCFLLTALTGCSDEQMYLHYALKAAGKNRQQLERVLYHYRSVDKDPSKLSAAKYLIANMPGHNSYSDTLNLKRYYEIAMEIQKSANSPEWQRDTLRTISNGQFAGMSGKVVSDVKIITADYLIYSIDRAFEQWRTRPWAQHLTYDEFRDWILPYKVIDYQLLDNWRDVLSDKYSDSINSVPPDDEQRLSIYGAIDIVRNEIHTKNVPRVLWEERSGIPLRSATTWANMTFGDCYEYVTMGTATFRSLGLPSAVDRVPSWGRNSNGHSWFTFLSDKGKEVNSINSLIMPAGMPFYPYERIPKVWRDSYTINRDRVYYSNKSKYKYPFELCKQDVTDHYCQTSDLEIPLDKGIRLKEKYAYIAMAANLYGPSWSILDFGPVRHGRAHFSKMGRNMLYVVLGYDGNGLVPVSSPFILSKSGNITYVNCQENPQTLSVDIRRKYYESYNVVNMRRRILGGRIQCSNHPDFSDALTLYTIDTTVIPHKIPVSTDRPYMYWRYLSPDGSWGSVAEVEFMDEDSNPVQGRGIAVAEAGQDAIDNAFDGNLLTNFEINQPDGNWVGIELDSPQYIRNVSIVPRSDDNDVCPGNEYELFCFNGTGWDSLGFRIATDNYLHFDNVPTGTLLWLRNYTRGHDERPFILHDDGSIEWW